MQYYRFVKTSIVNKILKKAVSLWPTERSQIKYAKMYFIEPERFNN